MRTTITTLLNRGISSVESYAVGILAAGKEEVDDVLAFAFDSGKRVFNQLLAAMFLASVGLTSAVYDTLAQVIYLAGKTARRVVNATLGITVFDTQEPKGDK